MPVGTEENSLDAFLEGVVLGCTVGVETFDGTLLRVGKALEGKSDGLRLGFFVGDIEGTALTTFDGNIEGTPTDFEGEIVGLTVNIFVGDLVGAAIGVFVDVFDGNIEGTAVGVPTDFEGKIVGLTVNVFVGDLVGTALGVFVDVFVGNIFTAFEGKKVAAEVGDFIDAFIDGFIDGFIGAEDVVCTTFEGDAVGGVLVGAKVGCLFTCVGDSVESAVGIVLVGAIVGCTVFFLLLFMEIALSSSSMYVLVESTFVADVFVAFFRRLVGKIHFVKFLELS